MTRRNDFWVDVHTIRPWATRTCVCRWKNVVYSATHHEDWLNWEKCACDKVYCLFSTSRARHSQMSVREIWWNCLAIGFPRWKNQTCAGHHLKWEPVDHLLDVIRISKVELVNRCVRSFAIQCVRLFDDLVLATTMLVLWMKMTRAVTMSTMLTTNSCFAIPGQISAARRWVCVKFFHVLVWRNFYVLLDFVNLQELL